MQLSRNILCITPLFCMGCLLLHNLSISTCVQSVVFASMHIVYPYIDYTLHHTAYAQ